MICCLNIFRVFFALALKHCFNIYPDVSTARNAMRISVSVSVSTTHVGRCMLALTAIYINIRALGLRRFFLFFPFFSFSLCCCRFWQRKVKVFDVKTVSVLSWAKLSRAKPTNRANAPKSGGYIGSQRLASLDKNINASCVLMKAKVIFSVTHLNVSVHCVSLSNNAHTH